MAVFKPILTWSAQYSLKRREGEALQFWKMKQLADDEKGHPCLSNVLSPSEVRCRRRVNCFGIFLFPSSCDLTCHTLGNLPFKTVMSCFFHSLVFSKLLGVAVESSSRNVPVSSHRVSRECIVYIHSHNINPSLFEPHAGLPRCRHLAAQKWSYVLGSGCSTMCRMVKKHWGWKGSWRLFQTLIFWITWYLFFIKQWLSEILRDWTC